jgi:hypothetical protein
LKERETEIAKRDEQLKEIMLELKRINENLKRFYENTSVTLKTIVDKIKIVDGNNNASSDSSSLTSSSSVAPRISTRIAIQSRAATSSNPSNVGVVLNSRQCFASSRSSAGKSKYCI